MEIDMVVKNGGGSDRESPDVGKKTGAKQTNRSTPKVSNANNSRYSNSSNSSTNKGRPPSQNYHGKNHRDHRKQLRHKMNTVDNDSNLGYDLDLSIEKELNNGNYKFRGGKAQVSINHLLQFQLPEIERSNLSDNRDIARRKNKSANTVHLTGDSFINANYRLLVDDNHEYKEQSRDPNIPIPQENIVRVVVPKGQQCPICLEEPVAPRMVACGHIFCYSCLINFFAVEDVSKEKTGEYVKKKKLKECPLCGNIVRQNKVKSVVYEEDSIDLIPKPNCEINLLLMCKPRGSLLALPVQLGVDPSLIGNFPSAKLDLLSTYAHIMKCNSEYAIEMLKKDIDAINTQYEIDKILYNDNGKYYKMAVKDIETHIESIKSRKNEDDMLIESLSNLDLGHDLKMRYDDSTAFFFFQTAFQSSTKFFLSPLDVKILLTAFHHYSEFPTELSMIVENVHFGSSVTEELLARYKYFGHLPFGTEIAFIDLDWRNNKILPKEVEQQFSSEIKQRRRKLKVKKLKEDKEKIRYQNKIEKEQKEFYKRENGDPLLVPEFTDHNSNRISLDSLSSVVKRPSSKDQKSRKGYVEKTIWGTSISLTEDKKTSKENQEFEAMLLQRMQESEESDSKTTGKKGKRGKKSKGKVMLFSNTAQTL